MANSSVKKIITIDLRGLNYPHFTGINTYTIHFLWCLFNIIASKRLNFHIVGVGLLHVRNQELQNQFTFWQNLFDQQITIKQYLPRFYTKSRMVANAIFSLQQSNKKHLTNSSCFQSDILIQTQPKALPRHPKTKRLVVFHDVFTTIFPEFSGLRQQLIENRNLYYNLAEDANYIFANSMATSQDIQALNPSVSSRISWVYPALPVWTEITKKQPINKIKSETISNIALDENKTNNSKNTYFLVLSGCERRKNWITIVQAYLQFQQKYPQFSHQLIFAGPLIDKKYHGEIITFIQHNNLQNIQFLGTIDESEKNYLLQNAAALVYPSLYEGFGFPILEAFKVATPVITSNVGSMPEIAKNSALLVHPLDIEELCEAMAMVAENKPEISEMVERGVRQLQFFSWNELERNIQKVLHLFS